MMVRVRIEVEGEAETNILREIFFCRILGRSQVSFKFSKIVEIPFPKFLLSKFYRTDWWSFYETFCEETILARNACYEILIMQNY